MSYFERTVLLANVVVFFGAAGFGWHLGASFLRSTMELVDLVGQWLFRPRRASRPHISIQGCAVAPGKDLGR